MWTASGFAWLPATTLVLMMGCLLAAVTQGRILCECLTLECREEGQSTCQAVHYCYSESVHGLVTKGCIDDSSPLLCENRKPQGKGVDVWPALFCCNDKDFCNRDILPRLLTPPSEVHPRLLTPADPKLSNEAVAVAGQPLPPSVAVEGQDTDEWRGRGAAGGGGGGRMRGRLDPHHPLPPCQNGAGDDESAAQRTPSSSSNNNSSGPGSKVINPIYIAVPVAGVCVLLALVIFAMYLLRRRQHHRHPFDSYHHYHDHLHHPHLHHHHPPAPPAALAKGPPGGLSPGPGGQQGVGGAGAGGVYHPHPHHPQPHVHCDCVCQKVLPPCAGKVNRCTDSERSSSGSETKLFLRG